MRFLKLQIDGCCEIYLVLYNVYISIVVVFLSFSDETLDVETIFRNSFSLMRQIRGNQDFFVYFAEISCAFHKILISET